MKKTIEVKNIFKHYGKQRVLNGLSLNISKGEIVSVVGGSGSGKTTLLRILSGLEIPEYGNINLDDAVVNSSDIFIPPEKRNCSLVFQDYALFPNMTVAENVAYGLRVRRMSKSEIEARVLEMLKMKLMKY